MKEYGKTENLFARDPDTHMLTPDFKIPEVGLIRNDKWIVTEKIDGTNIRLIVYPDGRKEVRGRSDNASLPKGLAENILRDFIVDGHELDALRAICGVKVDPIRPIGFCFYGEGYGAGIQKNGGRYSAEKRLAVFDLATFIYNEGQVEPSYLYSNLAYRDWATMQAACAATGLETVPCLSETSSLASLIELVYAGILTQVSHGWGTGDGSGGMSEGVVCRTDPYLYYGRNKSRLMFKCKTEDLRKSEASLGLDQHIPVALL